MSTGAIGVMEVGLECLAGGRCAVGLLVAGKRQGVPPAGTADRALKVPRQGSYQVTFARPVGACLGPAGSTGGYSTTTRYSAGWARTFMPLVRCWNSGEAAALPKWSADSHSATLT
jgi:hypothetical protein